MDKEKKPVNDIRVSFNTRIGGIVSYCERLLKENNMRSLNLSAVGGSIGNLVNAVEILKTIIPGLYQTNRLATISYQSVEEGGKAEAQTQRLYPKLEIKLTLDKPEKITEGFQDVLDEAKRKELLEFHLKRRTERKGRGRGRGGIRGRGGNFRGRRPFRGRRGGFRGRPPIGGRRITTRGRRGRAMRNGRGRLPVNRRGNVPKARGNPNRGRAAPKKGKLN